VTTKERNLAYLLGGVLVLVLAGVVGYMFIWSPYQSASDAVAKRHLEYLDLDEKAEKIKLDKRLFELARQQSLPADTKLSRGQYATFLETIGRKADISPSAMKVVSADPDVKSGNIQGTKKSAYTKLAYTVSLRADMYRVTDLLRRFYEQPLLHTIKSINIQKPSDARAQTTKELDVTLSIEALVLDGAPDRPSLLPVNQAVGLMSGAAVQTAYNWTAVTSGAGAPLPVRGVLADQRREYLSIAGKDPFYGPPPKVDRTERPTPPDDDSTPFMKLVSIVTYPDDGKIEAKFWDPLTNNTFTATQLMTTGAVAVLGEYTVGGKKKTLPGYSSSKERTSRDVVYGTEEGKNKRAWRVRRLTETEVILEKLDLTADAEAKVKATPAAVFGGGPGVFVGVPEGKVYRLTIGQTLVEPSILLTREAWRTIYARAKPPVSPAATTPTTEEGPPPEVVGANREE
jgi:hypothetical protein